MIGSECCSSWNRLAIHWGDLGTWIAARLNSVRVSFSSLTVYTETEKGMYVDAYLMILCEQLYVEPQPYARRLSRLTDKLGGLITVLYTGCVQIEGEGPSVSGS